MMTKGIYHAEKPCG